jgi:integrase/recombinase XerD
MRKGVRKHSRVTATRKITENFTMKEMFQRFMWFKNSEGLAPRTVEEYEIHFQWLCDYFGKDLSREEITTDSFLGWVDFMVHRETTETEHGQHSSKNNESISPLLLRGELN